MQPQQNPSGNLKNAYDLYNYLLHIRQDIIFAVPFNALHRNWNLWLANGGIPLHISKSNNNNNNNSNKSGTVGNL